jgi:hypothetical protein
MSWPGNQNRCGCQHSCHPACCGKDQNNGQQGDARSREYLGVPIKLLLWKTQPIPT